LRPEEVSTVASPECAVPLDVRDMKPSAAEFPLVGQVRRDAAAGELSGGAAWLMLAAKLPLCG
jgi:hypothetical protein